MRQLGQEEATSPQPVWGVPSQPPSETCRNDVLRGKHALAFVCLDEWVAHCEASMPPPLHLTCTKLFWVRLSIPRSTTLPAKGCTLSSITL